MSYRAPNRPPDKYEPSVFKKAFNRIFDAINDVARGVGKALKSVDRVEAQFTELQSVVQLDVSAAVEWYQITDTLEYAEARVIISKGLKAASVIRARSRNGAGNLDDTESWTDISGSFITDATYPGGGYYRHRVLMARVSHLTPLLKMQVQVKDNRGNMWLNEVHTFDQDREPFLHSFSLKLGIYDENAGTWPIYGSATGDEDVASIAFDIDTSAYNADPTTIASTDFATYVNARQVKSQSLGSVAAPASNTTTVYGIARAYSDVDKGGNEAFEQTIYQAIELPSKGSTTASLLEDSAKRASIEITAAHNGTTPATDIDVSGTISYADGTSYTIPSATLTVGGTLEYIYFDPSVSATALQQTTTEATAKTITGRRIFVGVAQSATAPERAFFVFSGDKPVITAPYIYAAKLSALSADMGSLTAGQIVVTTGSDKIWLNEGDDGVFAVGGSTKASAPFKVAADGTLTSTAGSVATNTSDIASLQGDMTTAQSDITTNASNISSNTTAVNLRVTKTTYEAGLDGDQFTTLSGTESGAQTEISVNTTPHALDDNDELLLYQSSDDTWKVLTVNGDHAAGVSAITIDSISLNGVSTDPILFSNKTAVGQIKVQADEIDLRVQYADVINAINISSEGITIDADNISIDGTTTFSSGYDPTERADVQRSSSAPTTRSDGSALQAGDMYTDTSNGEKPYVHTGSTWIAAYTVIDGGNITTGTIDASVVTVDNLNASNISTGTLGGITTGNLTASGIITAGTSNNVGVLDGADALWRIYAGHATPASAPFRVDQAGNLYAESATITGDFIANGNTVIDNGTGNIQNGNLTTLDITGDLTMNGGAIKVGTDVTIDASGITLDAGSTSGPAYSAATVLDFGGNLALWSYEATGIAHGVVEFTPTSTSSSFYLRMAGALGSHGTIGVQSGGNTLAVTTSGVSVVLASGDTFAVDGSAVISAADSLSALANVHSSTDAPTDGYIMEYDTTNGWQAVAPASTHAAVTLAGSYDYLTLSTQEITLGQIDLTTDVTGTLAATLGGTGVASYTVGDILYASTTTVLSKLSTTTAGYILASTAGAGSAPGYLAPTNWNLSDFTDDLTYLDKTGDTASGAIKFDAAISFTESGGAPSFSTNYHGIYATSAGLWTREGSGTSYAIINTGSSSYNNGDWDTAYTHSQVTSGNPHSVSASDVGLGSVENTALSTWAGTTNVTTLGTIGTGTWQGTAIASAYLGAHSHGGSELNGFTAYATIAAGPSGTLTSVSPGTSGYVLTSNGASSLPTYQAVSSYSSWTLDADTGTSNTVTSGETVYIYGSTGVDTAMSAGNVVVSLDLSELTDMTATMVGTDEFIVLDSSSERRKAANEIALSIFNDDLDYAASSHSHGGSDLTGFTAYATVLSGASGTLTDTGPGTSGYVLMSNGASSLPTYQAINQYTSWSATSDSPVADLEIADDQHLDFNGGDGIGVTHSAGVYTLTFAVDSTVVRTTGAQTLAGVKTFSAEADFTVAPKAPGLHHDSGELLIENTAAAANLTFKVNSTAAAQTLMYWKFDTVARMELNSDGDLQIDGTLTESSDRRLKSNIAPLLNSTSILRDINPVTYYKDGRMTAGLIAQEVAEVWPLPVYQNSSGYLGLSYTTFVPLLVASLKDAHARIDELETLLSR